MHIGIIGAGAIGLLLASILHDLAHVHLITRTQEQASKIRDKGIILDESKGLHVSQVEDFHHATENGPAQWDWAFITLKQHHLSDDLLMKLNGYLAKNTRIMCYQNGLGHLENVHKFLAPRPIYAAVTTEGALKKSSHHVIWTGQGHTWFGQIQNSHERSRISEEELILMANLRQAGISIDLSKEMDKKMWHKLLVNSVINPVTAIFSKRNGELLDNPNLTQLMRALLHEAIGVANKEGIHVQDMWDQVVTVCKRTAKNKSSMYMDILHNRKTEIDWINGFLINKAKEHRVYVETHQAIYDLIKEIEVGDTFCRTSSTQ